MQRFQQTMTVRFALALVLLLQSSAWGVQADLVEDQAVPTAATPDKPAIDLPHFQDLLRLMRSHLSGATEEDLNGAMVRGLLDAFYPRVQLVGEADQDLDADEEGELLRRVQVFQSAYGYVGVRRVAAELPSAITTAWAQLQTSNRVDSLQGCVLDLRAATGWDFQAAARTADLFVEEGHPLVRWGEEEVTSTAETTLGVPAVVLVNGDTLAAAEALAGALQAEGPAVLLGSKTAGQAYAMRDFDLPEGRRLRIASALVVVGENQSLEGGVEPDLSVMIPPELEQSWLADPYYVPEDGAGVANGQRIRERFDEAALMRQHAGLTNPPVDEAQTDAAGIAGAVLQDPVLVRALDVLKGLSRVRGGIRR